MWTGLQLSWFGWDHELRLTSVACQNYCDAPSTFTDILWCSICHSHSGAQKRKGITTIITGVWDVLVWTNRPSPLLTLTRWQSQQSSELPHSNFGRSWPTHFHWVPFCPTLFLDWGKTKTHKLYKLIVKAKHDCLCCKFQQQFMFNIKNRKHQDTKISRV